MVGPAPLPETGYTAKTVLRDLPAGAEIFYRVTFQDLGNLTTLSAPAAGRLRTAPAEARDVVFLWSADIAGQGWGINADWGGMYFGHVKIDGRTRVMTVGHRDVAGTVLHEVQLTPSGP